MIHSETQETGYSKPVGNVVSPVANAPWDFLPGPRPAGRRPNFHRITFWQICQANF